MLYSNPFCYWTTYCKCHFLSRTNYHTILTCWGVLSPLDRQDLVNQPLCPDPSWMNSHKLVSHKVFILVQGHWVLEAQFRKRDCWVGGNITFIAISYSLGGSVFLPAPGFEGVGCCLLSVLGSHTRSEDHLFGGCQSWAVCPSLPWSLRRGA